MKKRYNINKKSKVGDKCECPSCGEKFIKEHHQQAFCKSKSGTKCKDKYWNTMTLEKRNNTTRISPANARWMFSQKKHREYKETFEQDGFDHCFSNEH